MGSIFKSTNNTRLLKEGSHKYIRSDVPYRLSDDEISWLLNNKVTTIIDLRTADEIAVKPCPLAKNKNFTYINIPITGGNAIPKIEAAVVESYINMVDDTFGRVIDIIETSPENVLCFCNAGKDRTGVVSAVLLSRMGSERAEIVSNYMESKDNLKEMLSEFADKNREVDINVITPREEYIIGLLTALNTKHR